MDSLTTEEIQKLMVLLGKIPNIHLPQERTALLAGLPQELLNNIPLGHEANIDISYIVTTLTCEAYFCYGEMYPIMVVIQNAQNKIGRGELRDQLEEFLEEMHRRYNIDLATFPSPFVERNLPPLSHVKASTFQEAIDAFLRVASAYQQWVLDDAAVFKKHVLPGECQKINVRLNEVLACTMRFASTLQPSNNASSIIIAHGLQSLKEVNIFVKEAKILATFILGFCQTYGSVLLQPEEQRKKIYQLFGNLSRQCAAMVAEVEKLRTQL